MRDLTLLDLSDLKPFPSPPAHSPSSSCIGIAVVPQGLCTCRPSAQNSFPPDLHPAHSLLCSNVTSVRSSLTNPLKSKPAWTLPHSPPLSHLYRSSQCFSVCCLGCKLQGAGIGLLCLLLCSQHLEQFLARYSCSINICWTNE